MRREPGKELDELAYKVIGAAMDVHRKLGAGFLERVYEEALCVELRERGIAFEQQVEIAIDYKGHAVGKARLDLLIEKKLIVELKTVEQFAPIHKAQAISYLRATGLDLALLINFNVPILKEGLKRVILSEKPWRL